MNAVLECNNKIVATVIPTYKTVNNFLSLT